MTCVAVGFLAFLGLAFPRNFLRFRLKSLRFARNSCAAEILAFWGTFLRSSKFMRFSENSCVLLRVIAPIKFLAFQRLLLLRPRCFVSGFECTIQNHPLGRLAKRLVAQKMVVFTFEVALNSGATVTKIFPETQEFSQKARNLAHARNMTSARISVETQGI